VPQITASALSLRLRACARARCLLQRAWWAGYAAASLAALQLATLAGAMSNQGVLTNKHHPIGMSKGLHLDILLLFSDHTSLPNRCVHLCHPSWSCWSGRQRRAQAGRTLDWLNKEGAWWGTCILAGLGHVMALTTWVAYPKKVCSQESLVAVECMGVCCSDDASELR
jgi:hypothetical protein